MINFTALEFCLSITLHSSSSHQPNLERDSKEDSSSTQGTGYRKLARLPVSCNTAPARCINTFSTGTYFYVWETLWGQDCTVFLCTSYWLTKWGHYILKQRQALLDHMALALSHAQNYHTQQINFLKNLQEVDLTMESWNLRLLCSHCFETPSLRCAIFHVHRSSTIM